MIKLSPNAAHGVEAYKPLLVMLESILISPSELAEHWRVGTGSLASHRHANTGVPFLKLSIGRVRYRLSDVIADEIQGIRGPLTLDSVLLAVAACQDVSLETRAIVQRHLRRAFEASGANNANQQA